MAVSAPRNIPFYQANKGGIPEDFLLSGNNTGDYMYFRQPNGFLTFAHVGLNNMQMHAYQDEGWVALRDYGQFDFPKPYYADHPFEVLFLRGGAHEMSVAQVQALGYDRNPPILPRCNLAIGTDHLGPTGRPHHFQRCWQGAQRVHFPQLEGVPVVPVPECEFCDRNDFPSAKCRDQHMRVVHVKELGEIAAAREMAKSVGLAIAAHNQISPGVGLPIAGMAAQPFGCGLCGETFPKMRGTDGLEAHVKLHDDIDAPDSTE